MSLPRAAFASSIDEEKRRQEFRVEIRAQTDEELAQEVYSPLEPLQFNDERKLRVYESGPMMRSLQWKKHLPKPPIFGLSLLAIYKLAFAYTGLIWVFLPLCPVLVLSQIQRNLNENCEVQVQHLNLLKNGM